VWTRAPPSVRLAWRGPARRYARALLEVALAQAEAERIRRELGEAAALLQEHGPLLEALTHPAVGAEGRKRLVQAVWVRLGAAELLMRLLALLAEKNRLALLPAIADSFAALWNAHRGVVSAEAVSATPLDRAQQAALEGAIAQVTGSTAELKTCIEPALLGGVLVRVSGRTYDGSVRRRLQTLRQRLAGVEEHG
jgi:F-type H+-transporting ATPase subunit delta